MLVVAACSSAPVEPTTSVSGNRPTVVLQAPVNGAVVAVGASVAVSGAASDTVGVDHVALFADGVSFATTPAGTPAPLVPFSLTWLATPAGPHVLQVIAYRADGTASDPAVANVIVGAGGSGAPLGSPSASFPTLPSLGLPTLPPPPPPTKKPKPTKPPATPTPPPTPTPVPTVLPSADTNGYAPDDIDNEPYEIQLMPKKDSVCPPIDKPISAVGCIWEQISAPAGDVSDDLEFTQAPDTWYHVVLTSCTDTSDATIWGPTGDDTSTLGCLDFLDRQSSGGNPGSFPITVGLPSTVTTQTYNLYQLTVYQCKFANCATQ